MMRVLAQFTPLAVLFAWSVSAAADPSAIPVRSLDAPGNYVERLRVTGDFDRDGRLDMALSEPLENFGRSGGMFEIYLSGAGGSWKLIGDVMLHPKAISLESVPAKPRNSRIWTYMRGGGYYGGLGYFEISPSGVKDFKSIEINAGDAGTSTGNAMYQAVFDHSDLEFQIELSTTADDGTVSWEEMPQPGQR